MAYLLDLFHAQGSNFQFIKMIVPSFMAILFLQSGFDKALNYAGTLTYFQGQFKDTPLSKTTHLLLPMLTILEIVAGAMCAIGVVVSLLNGNDTWAIWGLMCASLALMCLFFGQRMSKDYAGSAALMGYVAVNLIGLLCY